MGHNRIQQFISFFSRHFFASIISIIAAILVTMIAYFTLLIVAIMTNSALGGPLSLPFFIAAASILSLFYTACLLFPSVAIAELLSQRIRAYRFLAQGLISIIMLVILVSVLIFGILQVANFENQAVLKHANHPVQIILVLCLPLGLYWCTLKIVEATTAGIIALWKKLFRNE